MEKVFVFRIADNEHNEIISRELKNARLRQGWGGKGSELQEGNEEQWIAHKIANLEPTEENRRYYKKRYQILKRLLEIKPEDIIIIPKTPAWNQFTICRAAGRYTFEEISGHQIDDFQHMIPVKNIKTFSYHSSEKSEIIHAKLRAYQSAVNCVYTSSVVSAARELIEAPENTEELTTAQMVAEIKNDIYANGVLCRFRNLRNDQTEKITCLILEKMGFQFLRRNSYDREGGDADLIFANNSLSNIMDVGINAEDKAGNIYVQVKNKYGKDHGDTDGVRQLINRTQNEPNAVKILISTVDEFTEECVQMANRENVLLINGRGFIELIFRYLN